MMALPVSGSWPTVYRPSHRPSFRFLILPSPFARLFGMVSAPFANEQYRNQEDKATEKRNRYQKVIICPSEPRRLIFAYCGAISALPRASSLVLATQILHYRGRSLWFQRCDFRTAEKPFLLTTAAQNIPVFLRKSPLLKEHFFEWLKTANFSTACETSTLKRPPSRGSDAPHVHPRLRKRPPGCT